MGGAAQINFSEPPSVLVHPPEEKILEIQAKR